MDELTYRKTKKIATGLFHNMLEKPVRPISETIQTKTPRRTPQELTNPNLQEIRCRIRQ